MNTKNGLLFALGAAALATALGGGGAAAQRGNNNRGGASSLPQVTCASGARPSSQAGNAQGTLNRALLPIAAAQKQTYYQQAYDQALTGVTADANNPFNYFVAAQAAAGLNQPLRADSLFRRTVELCPEFATEVAPARKAVAGQLVQTGLEAFQRNDTTAALNTWAQATAIDSTLTDAIYYIGVFSGMRGDNQRAVSSFRRILALPAPEASDSDHVQQRMVSIAGLLDVSARMLNANQNQQAIDILADVLRLDPNNRNALYYTSLALYKMQRWADLLPVAERVMRVDPLNGNEALVMFAAHRALADVAKGQHNTAVETQHRNAALRLPNPDSMQVTVDQVNLTTENAATTVRGVVTGAAARPGTAIRLEFTLFNPTGDVGTGTVTVTAPEREKTANFEFNVPSTGYPTSFRYRLLP
jgi:tetratricopeptide (TPR) repeat protein